MTHEAHMTLPERGITAVAEAVRSAKDRKEPCSILIGAGCSAPSIPLASEFVDIVKDRYPVTYDRAQVKSYPYVMRELLTGQRNQLIADYVNGASLNWSHIYLGWLIENGFVGRVLTTNFDNLVQRACSLYDLYPSVYDLASSPKDFNASLVQEPSLFFLHGQFGGFVQLHTPDEVDKHADELKPAFNDASIKRTWIVVGYSGDNDPVFENLANITSFDFGLYWVAFKDNDPIKAVQERLLTKNRQAYLVRGYDSDNFFRKLAIELKLESPPFVSDPFTPMINTMSRFAPIAFDDIDIEQITKTALGWLKQARTLFVENSTLSVAPTFGELGHLEAQASKLLLEGDYDGVLSLRDHASGPLSQSLAESLSWACLAQAAALSDQAKTKEGKDADRLFELAGEKFAAALEIKEDKHEAFNNWGAALLGQAKTKEGKDADRLFELAGEKYAAALEIKEDNHSTVYNIACMWALKNDVSKSLSFLRELLDNGTLKVAIVEVDSDFDGIRQHPDFLEFMKELILTRKF